LGLIVWLWMPNTSAFSFHHIHVCMYMYVLCGRILSLTEGWHPTR
jgi:hypothetical protein